MLSHAICAALIAACAGVTGWALWPEASAPIPKAYLDAQEAHLNHTCASMEKVGTGFTDFSDFEAGMKRGWLASMIPGLHRVRVVGGGTVQFGPQRIMTKDVPQDPRLPEAEAVLRPGHYTLISLFNTTASTRLEWMTPGSTKWENVNAAFMYPARHDEPQKLVDIAIRDNTFIPGMMTTPLAMMDPSRLVKPEDMLGAVLDRRSREAWASVKKQEDEDL